MPLRSAKMKRFILGFQRRVWCPKWTPLSSSWRMVTTAMTVDCSLILVVRRAGRPAAWRPSLAAYHPMRDRDQGGRRVDPREPRSRSANVRAREVDHLAVIATNSVRVPRPGPEIQPCWAQWYHAQGPCADRRSRRFD